MAEPRSAAEWMPGEYGKRATDAESRFVELFSEADLRSLHIAGLDVVDHAGLGQVLSEKVHSATDHEKAHRLALKAIAALRHALASGGPHAAAAAKTAAERYWYAAEKLGVKR